MSSAMPAAFSVGDVDDDDIRQFLDGDGARDRRADIPGAADDGDFAIHETPPRAMTLSPLHFFTLSTCC